MQLTLADNPSINFDLLGYPIFTKIEPLRIPYMGSKNRIAEQLMLKDFFKKC